jgi:hypothetical protein
VNPWFQSGQVLLACCYHAAGSERYPGQLKKAAAYAADRTLLKEHISQFRVQHPTPGPSPQREGSGDPAAIILPPESPSYERMTQEELLAIVKKRLAEIEAETSGMQPACRPGRDAGYSLPAGQAGMRDSGPESRTTVSKTALIDRFILEEPKITKPRAVFFSPSESAIRSNFDDEEIVSETLAQLFTNQGNVHKAIHIYKKLSLLNQEKSRYFAAQIEKLESGEPKS